MTIVDRYLLRQYFRVFLMVFLSLLGIYVVADFVGNLAEFVDYGQENDSLAEILANFYGARVPWFFDIASRNVALLAAVFAIAWMQRDNELTALMAAGVSPWRISKPLIVASVIIAVLAAANRELGIPRFRKELCRNAQDLIRNRAEKITPRYDRETDILFDGDTAFPRDGLIQSPRLLLPITWQGIGRKLTAATAKFQPATESQPAGYLLDDVDADEPLDQLDALVVGERRLIVTAKDDTRLAKNQVFVISRMSVDQLRRGRQWQQFTSTATLVAGMRSGVVDYSPDVRVMMHARLLQPFLDVTLIFYGLPLALALDRRHIVTAAAKSLLALIGFGIVVLVCHGLGVQCVVSPALAAWLPLIVLIPIAFLVSKPLRD